MAVVGNAELDVVGDEGVEDRVRDLIADLVRMAFGNGFAGKKIVFERQNALPQFALDSGQGSRAANVRLSLYCRGGKSSKSVRGGIDHRGRAAKNSRCRRKSRASGRSPRALTKRPPKSPAQRPLRPPSTSAWLAAPTALTLSKMRLP